MIEEGQLLWEPDQEWIADSNLSVFRQWQLRERGHSVHDATVAAAKVRLRPILMTAGVLIASMLPLSFHLAPGGEAMIPLARALIGGMLVSTVLTLFLVPCVYTLVKRDIQPVAT